MKCVVIVLVPLVPLLEEALQGAKDAGIKAFHIRDLPEDRDGIVALLEGGCIVFCSYEAASSAHTTAVCEVAVDIGGLSVIDEAHMSHMDMRCIQLLRGVVGAGGCMCDRATH